MVDYLIIGAGIAGLSFVEHCLRSNKTFHVFDNGSQNSSTIAGGMYNPVVLKRFTPVWKAHEQMVYSIEFFKTIESRLNCKLLYPMPILRKFYSIEEQNNWFHASDQPILDYYLNPSLVPDNFPYLKAPFLFGEVLHCGIVDTSQLLNSYHSFLNNNALLSTTTFDYSELIHNDDHVAYKGFKARYVVFSEGFGLHDNPFFNQLPLDGTKGELLIIKASDLNIHSIVKSGCFILPMGDDLYKVGATYEWNDKSQFPTTSGRVELESHLSSLISCPYEVIGHLAGIRPTVKDRRPLVGVHPRWNRFAILNGLGTRGVMLGPSMSLELFDHLENKKPLDSYVDIKRFKKLIW